MALRPFSRQPRDSEDEAASSDPSDVLEASPPSDARPDGATGLVALPDRPEPPVPTVELPDHAGPGWYRDTSDSTLMRYWDGFHLTGQVMHVHARAGEAEGDPSTAAPERSADMFSSRASDRSSSDRRQMSGGDRPAPVNAGAATTVPSTPQLVKVETVHDEPTPAVVSLVDLDRSVTGRPAGDTDAARDEIKEDEEKVNQDNEKETGREMSTGVEAKATEEADRADDSDRSPVDDAVVEADKDTADAPAGPAFVAASFEDAKADAPGPNGSAALPRSTAAPKPGVVSGDATSWAEQTEQAVARATAAGTPETWQEAARAAAVVAEMAQTMQVAAGAAQVASQREEAARLAAEQAQVAARKAADAKREAEQATRAAEQAAEAAKRAEQAAESAKREAERTAEEAPKLEEAAKSAAQASADARRKAESLEGIVATASTANTPAAWSEALKRSSAEEPAPV